MNFDPKVRRRQVDAPPTQRLIQKEEGEGEGGREREHDHPSRARKKKNLTTLAIEQLFLSIKYKRESGRKIRRPTAERGKEVC